MAGFRLVSKTAGLQDLLDYVQGPSNTTFVSGSAIVITNGVAAKATATAKPVGIVQTVSYKDSPGVLRAPGNPPNNLKTSTTDATTPNTQVPEPLQFIPCAGNGLVFECDITPLINGTAAAANTAYDTVIFDDGVVTASFAGGTVYIPELGEQRTITADTVSTTQHTCTVTPPFSKKPSNADSSTAITATVKAVLFAKGKTGLKLDATNPDQGLGTASGDASSGNVKCEGVDLRRGVARVSFVPVP